MIEKILVILINLKTSFIAIDQELITLEDVMIIIVKKTTSEKKTNITKIIVMINTIKIGMKITGVGIITLEDAEVEVGRLFMLIVI
jgi:hypothetical protein